jgi:hypothetical protein
MDDRIGSKLRQQPVKGRPVRKFPLNQSSGKDGPLVPRGEIIVHQQFVPLLPQRLHHMAADIPGAAGYQYLRHLSSLYPMFFHQIVQSRSADAEDIRRLGDIPPLGPDRGEDHFPLQSLSSILKGSQFLCLLGSG